MATSEGVRTSIGMVENDQSLVGVAYADLVGCWTANTHERERGGIECEGNIAMIT